MLSFRGDYNTIPGRSARALVSRQGTGSDYHRLLLALDAPIDVYVVDQPPDVAGALGVLRDRQQRAGRPPRTAALLGLNEQEQAYLASCRMVKGVGSTELLLADGERTPVMIPLWPETLHQVVTGCARASER